MGNTSPPRTHKNDVVIFCFLKPRKNKFHQTTATIEGSLTLMKPNADVTLVFRQSDTLSFFSRHSQHLHLNISVSFVKAGGLLFDILFIFFIWRFIIKA